MSQLLTPSESLAFNGFLSAIDLGGVLDGWNAIADSAPLPTARGKEALTKATKDLMSLESHYSKPDNENNSQSKPSAPVANSNWPALPADTDAKKTQGYTYGFGTTRSSSRSLFPPSPSNASSAASHSQAASSYGARRSRSPSSAQNTFSSSSSFFPSAPAPSSPNQPRPGPVGASSAPAILTPASSSSKRALPPDSDAPAGPSSASMKRRRPSEVAYESATAGSAVATDAKPQASSRAKPTRSASTSSSTAAAAAAGASQSHEPATPSANRPSLLSPLQKRANHIQSEQKRRANIRKGYEALCEAVPALRDAIRLEEEAARTAEDEKEKGRKRKRKTKGASAQLEEPSGGIDGRAGPKSENVVLQKTIDHLHFLLSERDALTQRLSAARLALPPVHPALEVSRTHLDDDKVPLWEREWNGGTGWGEEVGDEE